MQQEVLLTSRLLSQQLQEQQLALLMVPAEDGPECDAPGSIVAAALLTALGLTAAEVAAADMGAPAAQAAAAGASTAPAAGSGSVVLVPASVLQFISPAATAGLEDLADLLPVWSFPLGGMDELRQAAADEERFPADGSIKESGGYLSDPSYSSGDEAQGDDDDADDAEDGGPQKNKPAHGVPAVKAGSATPSGSNHQQQQQQQTQEESAGGLLPRCTTSSQSQSSHGVTQDMLRTVYDLPISKAARHLGVGVTVLKRICRDLHISRWPYRKRQSLHKLMATVENYSHTSSQSQAVQSVCQQLQAFLDELMDDPDREMEARIKKLRQAIFKQEYKARQGKCTAAATAMAQEPADSGSTNSEDQMVEY
ncbi:RWP-RK domain-containing protein [Scenedesmus sp. NREL 46B-D3]|nr:RWP-RK domain-containing protein [Scenedesmus sp. NREL 46B-D3]